MAITATIAVSPSTIAPNQQATVSVTVSNSGAAAVNVIGFSPIAGISGDNPPVTTVPVAFGSAALGPAENITVPAGGTLVIPYGVTAFQSQAYAPWLPITVYGPGAFVRNDGGKVYQSTGGNTGTSGASPGPTGTGATIVDGTVTWSYQATPSVSVYDLAATISTSDGSVTGASPAATLTVITAGN